MVQSAPRSLKHEYDLFVENEIEAYKESISRTTLLKIGDEAVASLQSQMQLGLDELLLVHEVDRIIRKRLRLPSYATWRKKELKRRKEMQELSRPEYWGVRPDSPVAREIHPSADTRVLVAGEDLAGAALYLAANGCSVTAIEPPSAKDPNTPKSPRKADLPNLPGRIDRHSEPLNEWALEAESLNAVVFTPAAFAGLSAQQRAHVIEVLQSATEDGGVHLIETIAAGRSAMSLSELRKSYKGWQVSVLGDGATGKSFLARKAVA
jgi:hypothetical protein